MTINITNHYEFVGLQDNPKQNSLLQYLTLWIIMNLLVFKVCQNKSLPDIMNYQKK